MKFLLSCLLEIVYQKGIFTKEEVEQVKSLVFFERILQEKVLNSLASKEEKDYLVSVSSALESGDFEGLKLDKIPVTMKSFHRKLLKVVSELEGKNGSITH